MKRASLNKKVEAVSKLLSSSSSIMDDAGPRSLFVVVYYGTYMEPHYSILQLETSNHEYAAHLTPEGIKKREVDQKEHVVRFNQLQDERLRIRWLFSPPTSSTEDLYMVANWGYAEGPIVKPYGYKFNFRTGSFQPINPPMSSKMQGHVVNLRGRIYFMAQPAWHYIPRDSVFECYDPDKKSWKALKPFPVRPHFRRCIVATAVWGDTILFSMGFCGIWAYDVRGNEWYPVGVEDDRCYSIEGEAVVLENTIYALTDLSFDLVLALSIEKEEINGDLVFKCSVSSEHLVPGMKPILVPVVKPILFRDDDIAWRRSTHLVHLGKDNFCLVQSCNLIGHNDYQPIQLTYIKLKRENSMIVDECVHEVKIQHDEQFEVYLCFSLPKCKTTTLEEGRRFDFELDPFPKDFASKQEYENVTLPKDEEGHSVYVRNLPRSANVGQLEKGLKKFGPIKSDGIQVGKNKKGKSFAYVEFDSATSKQRAIEASTIRIGGCQAEILEKR